MGRSGFGGAGISGGGAGVIGSGDGGNSDPGVGADMTTSPPAITRRALAFEFSGNEAISGMLVGAHTPAGWIKLQS